MPLQRPGLTSAAVRRSPFTLVVALPALVRPAPLVLVNHSLVCGGLHHVACCGREWDFLSSASSLWLFDPA